MRKIDGKSISGVVTIHMFRIVVVDLPIQHPTSRGVGDRIKSVRPTDSAIKYS